MPSIVGAVPYRAVPFGMPAMAREVSAHEVHRGEEYVMPELSPKPAPLTLTRRLRESAARRTAAGNLDPG